MSKLGIHSLIARSVGGLPPAAVPSGDYERALALHKNIEHERILKGMLDRSEENNLFQGLCRRHERLSQKLNPGP